MQLQQYSSLLSPSQRIDSDHLVRICKYRQNNCCRYIVYFLEKGDFYCVKKISPIKEKLELHLSEMKAQGDNCPGLQ